MGERINLTTRGQYNIEEVHEQSSQTILQINKHKHFLKHISSVKLLNLWLV